MPFLVALVLGWAAHASGCFDLWVPGAAGFEARLAPMLKDARFATPERELLDAGYRLVDAAVDWDSDASDDERAIFTKTYTFARANTSERPRLVVQGIYEVIHEIRIASVVRFDR